MSTQKSPDGTWVIDFYFKNYYGENERRISEFKTKKLAEEYKQDF